ncbi:MAG TPA: DinB family protein [Dehalococcoidia bacterium]|nr:DinB family protein [Dehalococcoidia bacterium]
MEQLKEETFEPIRLLLAAVGGLSDEQGNLRPGGTLPSIAFHVWHSARWADYDCEIYGGVDQVWLSEGFAERWNLQGIDLSDGGTGTGLGDEETAALQLPGRDELLAYASAAFRLLQETVAGLDDTQLASKVDARDGTHRSVQALLFMHLTHVNRHLGMVEAIKGLQGMRGTATR